jgi:hypothetical protein
MATSSGENEQEHVDIAALQNVTGDNDLLLESLVNLSAAGVPTALITRDTIHALYLTVPGYLKEIRNLAAISELPLLDRIFAEAIKAGIFEAVRTCGAKDILNIARWTKRGVGAERVAEAQQRLKLLKKATGAATPEQISRAQGLNLMIQDMSAMIKENRSKKEAEIARLQRDIDRLRREIVTGEEDARGKFGPAARYTPLNKEDFSKRCWDKYLGDCQVRGAPALPWTDIAMAHAENTFGGSVQAEHVQDFVLDPSVAKEIDDWMLSKILSLEGTGHFREAKIFRRLLGGASGGAAVVIPATIEVETPKPSASGKSKKRKRTAQKPPTVPMDASSSAKEQAAAGDTEATPPPKTTRSDRRKRRAARKKQKVTGDASSESELPLFNPNGDE